MKVINKDKVNYQVLMFYIATHRDLFSSQLNQFVTLKRQGNDAAADLVHRQLVKTVEAVSEYTALLNKESAIEF
ncbi:hypothetical protein ACUHGC_07520 [Testudinibacter sp. P27/CKL/0425]